MRQFVFATFTLLLALMLAPVAIAQDDDADTPFAELGLPDLVFSTNGTAIDAPTALEAARYHLILENSSETLTTAVEFYLPPEGNAAADLIPAYEEAAANNVPPPFFFESTIAGGATARPGETTEAVLDLGPGDWLAAIFAYDDTGDSFLAQTISVTGELADADDPDSDVDVNLIDFAFDMPDSIPAGPLVWEIENDGAQPHFIAIYSYAEALTDDTVNAGFFETYGFSPSEFDPEATAVALDELVEVGGSATLSSDQANWIELDLEAGQYLALCLVADQTNGSPHAPMGQFLIFEVV